MMKNLIFMLDSGAFSAWKKNTSIDIEQYAEFVNDNRDLFRGGVFNLDVKSQTAKGMDEAAIQSYENWIELRRLGVNSIPIFHVGEDEKYLKRYVDECDYIGIGGIAESGIDIRLYGLDHLWKSFLLKPDGSARVRVHGLGLSAEKVVLRYPWFSLDSTKTIGAAAFGSILVPRITKNGPSFDLTKKIQVSDQGRNHIVNSAASFFSLPKMERDAIREYCSSLGYEISVSLDSKDLRPKVMHRKKKDALWTNPLGIELQSVCIDDAESDLSNNLTKAWKPRYALNLHTTDKFYQYHRSQGKTYRAYSVIASTDIFKFCFQNHPADNVRILGSYFYKNLFTKTLKEIMQGVNNNGH
jgi:hypothetical protein